MVWLSFCMTEIKTGKTMEEKATVVGYERALEKLDHPGNNNSLFFTVIRTRKHQMKSTSCRLKQIKGSNSSQSAQVFCRIYCHGKLWMPKVYMSSGSYCRKWFDKLMKESSISGYKTLRNNLWARKSLSCRLPKVVRSFAVDRLRRFMSTCFFPFLVVSATGHCLK